MYVLKKNFLANPTPFYFFWNKKNHNNPTPRTGPQDLLVTHYEGEQNEQKNYTSMQ